jgi:hypothetical protein
MLESLRAEVKTYFQYRAKPRKEELVVWDGFDELDKPSAVDFYNGKSWEDVLHYLQDPTVGNFYLEEWAVLGPQALAYYLRAYWEFLIETLSSQEGPDEGYVSELFHWLYQMIYMHKGSPLNPEQTAAIVKIAEHVTVEIQDYQRFPEIGEHISRNIDMFLQELIKYRM